MAKKQKGADATADSKDLTKILMEIEAFDQVQTTDRLRQWLENPERLPKRDSLLPNIPKRPKK